MLIIILLFHVLLCVALIVLVLIQHGKGADMGASFGAGASQTVFGSQGSGWFLLKVTGILALLFFGTNIVLGRIEANRFDTARQAMLASSNSVPVSAPALPATPANSSSSVPAMPNSGKPTAPAAPKSPAHPVGE